MCVVDASAQASLGVSQQLALKPVQPLSLAWQDVSLTLPPPKNKGRGRSTTDVAAATEPRHILRQVRAHVLASGMGNSRPMSHASASPPLCLAKRTKGVEVLMGSVVWVWLGVWRGGEWGGHCYPRPHWLRQEVRPSPLVCSHRPYILIHIRLQPRSITPRMPRVVVWCQLAVERASWACVG